MVYTKKEYFQISPLGIFGDELSSLLGNLIKEAKKQERMLNNKLLWFKKLRRNIGLPDYLDYSHPTSHNIRYELYWNNKCLENSARWYSITENLCINKEWEIKYEHAKNVRIENVMRDLIKGGNTKRLVSCPFHKDNKPSMKIYPKTNSWYCFSCNRGGSPPDYIMQKNNLNFKEAVEFLYSF